MDRIKPNHNAETNRNPQEDTSDQQGLTPCPAVFLNGMTEAERYIFNQLYFAAFLIARQAIESRERFCRLIEDVNLSDAA